MAPPERPGKLRVSTEQNSSGILQDGDPEISVADDFGKSRGGVPLEFDHHRRACGPDISTSSNEGLGSPDNEAKGSFSEEGPATIATGARDLAGLEDLNPEEVSSHSRSGDPQKISACGIE